MVIDVLRMAPQMAQQMAYYGTFSDQIKDYSSRGLIKQFAHQTRGQDLLKIIDPFEYRAKIQQPKMIIAGDQ